jgi:hypothetical protein
LEAACFPRYHIGESLLPSILQVDRARPLQVAGINPPCAGDDPLFTVGNRVAQVVTNFC